MLGMRDGVGEREGYPEFSMMKERNRRENLSEKRRNIQLCVHNGKLK